MICLIKFSYWQGVSPKQSKQNGGIPPLLIWNSHPDGDIPGCLRKAFVFDASNKEGRGNSKLNSQISQHLALWPKQLLSHRTEYPHEKQSKPSGVYFFHTRSQEQGYRCCWSWVSALRDFAASLCPFGSEPLRKDVLPPSPGQAAWRQSCWGWGNTRREKQCGGDGRAPANSQDQTAHMWVRPPWVLPLWPHHSS